MVLKECSTQKVMVSGSTPFLTTVSSSCLSSLDFGIISFMWLFSFPSLGKEMATHSSTLAWRVPWMEEPGRLQSMGSQRVGQDWATSLHLTFLSQGQQVNSGVIQAHHWKPHVFSPAVKQEAAQDSRFFLSGSDILLCSTRTPHVEADIASHLHLWGLSWVWTLCWSQGACYLAVPERSLLFLFLYIFTCFLHGD